MTIDFSQDIVSQLFSSGSGNFSYSQMSYHRTTVMSIPLRDASQVAMTLHIYTFYPYDVHTAGGSVVKNTIQSICNTLLWLLNARGLQSWLSWANWTTTTHFLQGSRRNSQVDFGSGLQVRLTGSIASLYLTDTAVVSAKLPQQSRQRRECGVTGHNDLTFAGKWLPKKLGINCFNGYWWDYHREERERF